MLPLSTKKKLLNMNLTHIKVLILQLTIPTWEPPFVLRIQIELIQPRLKNYQWNNTTSLHVFPKTLKKLIKNNKTGVIFINKSDVHMMKSFLCKKLFASRKFILYSDQQNWDLKYLFLVIINYESCEAYFGKKSESCVWHTYVTVSYCTVLYVHTCNGQTDIINQSGQTLRFRHILYILTCWTSLQGRTSGVWELTPILPSTSIPCKLQ